MSEVVCTDPGPKVEIKIEEAATAGKFTSIPVPSLEGSVNVNPEDTAED